MIKKIRMLYRDVIEIISEFFTSDDYTFSYGKSDRFPSVLNVVFQRLLKYLHIVFPVGYILVVILNYETGDSILGLLFKVIRHKLPWLESYRRTLKNKNHYKEEISL